MILQDPKNFVRASLMLLVSQSYGYREPHSFLLFDILHFTRYSRYFCVHGTVQYAINGAGVGQLGTRTSILPCSHEPDSVLVLNLQRFPLFLENLLGAAEISST